jgi:hypothetical protein
LDIAKSFQVFNRLLEYIPEKIYAKSSLLRKEQCSHIFLINRKASEDKKLAYPSLSGVERRDKLFIESSLLLLLLKS